MAFRCPGFDETVHNRAALQAIDDLTKELKKEYECNCEYVPPAPKHGVCTCHDCECPCAPPKQFHEPEVCEPPSVMVCYKVPKARSGRGKQSPRSWAEGKGSRSNKQEEVVHRLTQSKSRELRAGIMYVGCHCEKRNGLQDDCQRTECHGSPACLTTPYPTCGPSEFANGKHLEKIWGLKAQALRRGQHDHIAGGEGGAACHSGFENGMESMEPDYEYHCFPATVKAAEAENNGCCPC